MLTLYLGARRSPVMECTSPGVLGRGSCPERLVSEDLGQSSWGPRYLGVVCQTGRPRQWASVRARM